MDGRENDVRDVNLEQREQRDEFFVIVVHLIIADYAGSQVGAVGD